MRATEAGRYGEGLFHPEETGEAGRIDLGALAYDEASAARLAALGAGPGWHCLDVGAGTGTVARWLLESAGVTGVLAVDRDTRSLDAGRTPGLSTLTADITAPDFDPGRFQLVHARFVLMHLRSWRRMIAKLGSLVAPGGVLVLSDAVDLTTAGAPATPYTTVMRTMWQGLRESIGTDISWVPDYPYLLREEGLHRVAAEIHVPPLVPGSPLNRFWADTWDRARGAMLATGQVDEAQIERARRALSSDECTGLSPGMLTAWGWRTEEAGRDQHL
ncbi:class I SAM-dependent methyltransferase [Streptomyces sp. NEAU-S7GS2]|uniref:class I SAM-dependent methyltransferase n=1 Tax=Streptomyces sp. NEAU-S7GS2 TaxID=2202000 RepID=UPI000D703883|nr:class I SAM-dependent methyltransferase [Streptomyces sp. NEAU-S7GS2]AWN31495.1 SAM-dependent methyltransferase [Streptomyces sp. NEAU-S7GS2]